MGRYRVIGGMLTSVNVLHHDLGSFVGEQSGCFGPNALP